MLEAIRDVGLLSQVVKRRDKERILVFPILGALGTSTSGRTGCCRLCSLWLVVRVSALGDDEEEKDDT